MKLIQLSLLVVILLTETLFAQSIQWTRTFGSTGQDGAESMVTRTDGAVTITGFKSLNDRKDILLLKTDANGNEIWSRVYNPGLNDIGRSIKQTSDGGYIITGMTEVTPQIFDPFLLKTDSLGNLQWLRQYNYGDDDRAHTVWQTSDGGYIFGGQTWLMHGAFGNYDMYIVKTDINGNVQWSKIFYREENGADVALGIQQLNDGGYIIGGFTQSSEWASYVIRTDNAGNALWSNIYPGSWQSECYDIQATADGGFIMTGTETSHETDGDLLLAKLDGNGNLLWKKLYGTTEMESGEYIQQLQDGGYIIAGMSAAAGSYDIYTVRTNSTGDSLWTIITGGGSDDRGHAVSIMPNGSFMVSGWTWSYGQGSGDVYLIKLSEALTGISGNNNIPTTTALSQNYPNPFNPNTQIKYQLSKAGIVKLKIYDALGKEIRTLVNEFKNAGNYEVQFDGSKLASGMYFYKIETESFSDVKKMVLIK